MKKQYIIPACVESSPVPSDNLCFNVGGSGGATFQGAKERNELVEEELEEEEFFAMQAEEGRSNSSLW